MFDLSKIVFNKKYNVIFEKKSRICFSTDIQYKSFLLLHNIFNLTYFEGVDAIHYTRISISRKQYKAIYTK